MIKRGAAMFALFLLTGCSVTLVWAPKAVSVEGSWGVGVHADITGSDIEDFTASQKADGAIDVPVLP